MKKIDTYILSTNIYFRRVEMKLSQQQLADRIGVSRHTIAQLENNHYNPSLGLAHLISNALGVRIDDLFTFTQMNEYDMED